MSSKAKPLCGTDVVQPPSLKLICGVHINRKNASYPLLVMQRDEHPKTSGILAGMALCHGEGVRARHHPDTVEQENSSVTKAEYLASSRDIIHGSGFTSELYHRDMLHGCTSAPSTETCSGCTSATSTKTCSMAVPQPLAQRHALAVPQRLAQRHAPWLYLSP
ncbi:unnamed protein product [Boreogadus saida]